MSFRIFSREIKVNIPHGTGIFGVFAFENSGTRESKGNELCRAVHSVSFNVSLQK